MVGQIGALPIEQGFYPVLLAQEGYVLCGHILGHFQYRSKHVHDWRVATEEDPTQPQVFIYEG